MCIYHRMYCFEGQMHFLGVDLEDIEKYIMDLCIERKNSYERSG